jgi:glutathione synthase
MPLKIAFQMDPIEDVNIDGDSTFRIAEEAQARGHELFYYTPDKLAFQEGRVTARGWPLTVRREKGNHFTLGEQEWIDLALVDVVLMRQDPPFDMAYITATHLLEHVHPDTLVVNDPVHVRNAPEKLFVAHFPELMPPTLITSNLDQIMEFRDEHRDLIVKPLFGNGGAGVFHIGPDDENLNSLLEMFTGLYREPIIIQRYEPAVRAGDKRIILIDGKPAGAVNRVPAKGESRSNLHVGGTALAATLNTREKEICDAIGPSLSERGLIFVGIDVIGDYLTEINVTSPTCLQEINGFDGVKLESDIWDAIMRKLAEEED